MDFYLPSDIARVVLSYLKENCYTKTYKCFIEECCLLQEYCMLVKTGRTPRITHLPQLSCILDEWGKLKQSERVIEKGDLSIQCSLSPEHHLVADNDVTKSKSVSPLKSITNLSARQNFPKCRTPSGDNSLHKKSDKRTPSQSQKCDWKVTPQSKKVLFSPKQVSSESKPASKCRSGSDECKSRFDSTEKCSTTNATQKRSHDRCTSSSVNANVETGNENCILDITRTVQNVVMTLQSPASGSQSDNAAVSLAGTGSGESRPIAGSKDIAEHDSKDHTQLAAHAVVDISSSIVPPDCCHATPKKTEVRVDPAVVTPIKLMVEHETNKSPRRKKPKTPRKRVSDSHIASTDHPAGKHVDEQPFFKQILSDTRLHEKIAETCNSLVSGGLKASLSHRDKSTVKENGNYRKLSAEEQETLFACKSLEEVLETGSDLDMLEKFDMSDPVYETLFKMFGTDRTTFLEGLRKEKSESEMQAETEEMERSIHEIYEECASIAANSPHFVHSQQDMLGQPNSADPGTSTQCSLGGQVNFTPLLRAQELGCSVIHTPASGSLPSSANEGPAHSQGSSPVYQPESPFGHSNPATPILDDPSQPHSDSMKLSSPNSHHHLHSTPHGPSSMQRHTSQTICSTNIPSNCSPLVKCDLYPGSPIMMQKNTPRSKKNILQSTDNSGSYFSSFAANRAHSTVQQSQHCDDYINEMLPSQAGLLEAQDEVHKGFLHLLGEAIEQRAQCPLKQSGSVGVVTSVSGNPCSTIENTIDCISLPKPNTTTVGARAHGQGMGKKGGRRKPSTKKSKKGQVKSKIQSFSTLKGLLEKPQLALSVLPLSETPKKNEASVFSNQNITIVSPGGSRIDIPLLECADDLNVASNNGGSVQGPQTISIWNQNCTSTAQCIVSQSVHLVSTNEKSTCGPATVSVSESTASFVQNTVEQSSLQENKKSNKGRKKLEVTSTSLSPRSGKSVELDMSDKLIATPILHNSVVDRAHVRSLNFGALANDPNIAQFRKIKPKLPEDSIAPRVIIVHAGQFVPPAPGVQLATSTPILTTSASQLIPVVAKQDKDETILIGNRNPPDSKKSSSEQGSPLKKTPKKNGPKTVVPKRDGSESNGDSSMDNSSVNKSKSPHVTSKTVNHKEEQNSSLEACRASLDDSRSDNTVFVKEKRRTEITPNERVGRELRSTKTANKERAKIEMLNTSNDKEQKENKEDLNSLVKKSQNDPPKVATSINKVSNHTKVSMKKESNGEKITEKHKHNGNKKHRRTEEKLKVKIPSASRTNANLKSPEMKKTLVVFTKKLHVSGNFENNTNSADDLPLAVLRKQIKQGEIGVKKCQDMVEHADNILNPKESRTSDSNEVGYVKDEKKGEIDDQRAKINDSSKDERSSDPTLHNSYMTRTNKGIGKTHNTESKGEAVSRKDDQSCKLKSNDSANKIKKVDSSNKLTADCGKVEDIHIEVCISKNGQCVEPSTPNKQVLELTEELTPSKEQMLEKVGLTPTKSVPGTVSPRKANVMELLSDWRRSPSAKTKTPNTRSKQRKLEEIMMCPSTPRRRSLFKSPPPNSKREKLTDNIDDKQTSEKTVRRVNNILDKLHKNNPENDLISCVKEKSEVENKPMDTDNDQSKGDPCQRLFAMDTKKAKSQKNAASKICTITDRILSLQKECHENTSPEESLAETTNESEKSDRINSGDFEELETSVNNLVEIMEKDVQNNGEVVVNATTSSRVTDVMYGNSGDRSCRFVTVAEIHVPVNDCRNTLGAQGLCLAVDKQICDTVHTKENSQKNASTTINEYNCGDQHNCDMATCDGSEQSTELLNELSVASNNNNLNTKTSSDVTQRRHKKKKKHKHRHRHQHDKSNEEKSDGRKHQHSGGGERETQHKHRHRPSESDPHLGELDRAPPDGERQSAHREHHAVDVEKYVSGYDSHKRDKKIYFGEAARDRQRNDSQHRDTERRHRGKRKRSQSPQGNYENKRPREEKSLADLNIDEALSILYAT